MFSIVLKIDQGAGTNRSEASVKGWTCIPPVVWHTEISPGWGLAVRIVFAQLKSISRSVTYLLIFLEQKQRVWYLKSTSIKKLTKKAQEYSTTHTYQKEISDCFCIFMCYYFPVRAHLSSACWKEEEEDSNAILFLVS